MLDRRQGHRRAIGLSGPTRTQRRGSSIVSRTAPPWRQAAQADRQAFDRALAPTYPELLRSEERRVGKSVDLGGRRIIKKKKREKTIESDTYRIRRKKAHGTCVDVR